MFVGITNTPRDYAWGSTTLLPEFFGRTPSGAPEAELWLGAHPGSPSVLTDAEPESPRDLAAWVSAEPGAALGPALAASARLPFLLKLLAAGGPLSLQAHPTMEQAAAGFARENAAGISADAAHRNYKDAFHKPELIVALSERFDALCGFRPLETSRSIVAGLRALDANSEAPNPAPFDTLVALLDGPDPLRSAVSWLLGGGEGVAELVARVEALAETLPADAGGELEPELTTVRELSASYPGDPGVVLALLLNRVRLAAGESLWLPAGNIHAYLSGLGVELMAASDNVLRGGLTPKHIDVPELVSVLDFSPLPVPWLVPEHPAEGVELFRPELPDFMLYRIAPAENAARHARIELTGPAIAIATSGSVRLEGADGGIELALGEAVYVTPDEAHLEVTGPGTVFVATVGASAPR